MFLGCVEFGDHFSTVCAGKALEVPSVYNDGLLAWNVLLCLGGT